MSGGYDCDIDRYWCLDENSHSLRQSDAYIYVSKLTIIGSNNGLSPGRHQAIIWTNAGILLIRISGTNFSEIFREIHTFSFRKMHLKMSSGKWQPFCLGLNDHVWGFAWLISVRIVMKWYLHFEAWTKWLLFCRWHFQSFIFALKLHWCMFLRDQL